MPNTTTGPESVFARYLTVAGATVDLTKVDRGPRGGGVYTTFATCAGCGATEGFHWENGIELADAHARAWAQSHAETCRALPRPGA